MNRGRLEWVAAWRRRAAWSVGVAILVAGCSSSSPTTPAAAGTTAATAPASAATAAPTAPSSSLAAADSASSEDFSGKTIHLVVGYAPGGGFDGTARLMAPSLAQALRGNPTVVVDNMAGADSLVAAKSVLTGPQHGTDIQVVVYISTLLAKSALTGGIDGFSPEKESAFIGKPDAAPDEIGLCANSNTVKNLDDFLSRTSPIKVAGLNGSSLYDSFLIWTKDAGFPIDIVFGYAATNQMALAFNQGEVDAVPSCRDTDLVSNPDWLDKGQITPLFYYESPSKQIQALQAQGKFPWYKNVLDVKPVSADQKAVLQTWLSINRGAEVYAVNKQTSPAMLAALRQAFKQVVTSPGYAADMDKRQLPVGYMAPDEIDKTIQDLSQASPAEQVLFKRMLAL